MVYFLLGISQALNIKSQRFGTLCRFHLHRWVGVNNNLAGKWPVFIQGRGWLKVVWANRREGQGGSSGSARWAVEVNTQKKIYHIYNTAKV
jgi:hypothetical protein